MKQLTEYISEAHSNSVAHGFWSHDVDCPWTSLPVAPDVAPCRCENHSTEMKIALIHSEISEALEEYRLCDDASLGVLSFDCPGIGERLAHDSAHGEFGNGICPRIAGENRAVGPHKPVGFMSELADVAIRVFDLTGARHLASTVADSFNARQSLEANLNLIEQDYGALFALAHEVTADTSSYPFGVLETSDSLASILIAVSVLARKAGGDLWAAIDVKMAYNKTRPMKHGGKRV